MFTSAAEHMLQAVMTVRQRRSTCKKQVHHASGTDPTLRTIFETIDADNSGVISVMHPVFVLGPDECPLP